MVLELAEKWILRISPRIDNHDDFHRSVDVTQIEYGFRNADRRPSRHQHGRIETVVPRMFERLLLSFCLDHEAAGHLQAPRQSLAGIGSDQEYPRASIMVSVRGHVATPMSAGTDAAPMECRYAPSGLLGKRRCTKILGACFSTLILPPRR
jgi:hypothetical protein